MKIVLAAAAVAQAVSGASSQGRENKPAPGKAGEAPPPANKWVAHTSDDQCWLIRGADTPKGTVFAISRVPGNERTSIWFVNPAWRRSPIRAEKDVEVSLERGGAVAAEVYHTKPTANLAHGPLEQSRIAFSTDESGLFDRLAEGGALSISEKGREIARTELPTMKKAIEALKACETEALQTWGIDPVAWHALRSIPRPITRWSDVLKSTDYPEAAMRKNVQGNVLVRLTIDASGTPIECRQILRTGNEEMDEKSCAAIRQLARFEPAIDADGRAVAAPYVTMVKWRLW